MGKIKIKKAVLCVGFTMSLLMASTSVSAQTTSYMSTFELAKEESFKYYEGKATSGVNVRVGAGTDQELLTIKGKGVTLTKGTKVTIIGSKKVGSKPWYKIRFVYDGQEVEGYATSTYIKKTGTVITPTPMPSPTPEPTTEPTKAPEATKSQDENATLNPTIAPALDAKTAKDTKPFVYVGIVLVLAIIGGGVYYYLRKKDESKETQANHVSEKVAKLKDIVIGSKEDNRGFDKKTSVHNEKKKPEVRVSKRDKVLKRADLITSKSEVYVLNSKKEHKVELELAPTEEEAEFDVFNQNEQDISYLQQESNDKKELRIAINNLREHDIIIHKFFGKGEVYDNSDVRLIEVRFGGDTRFLNKEQLVNKKIIQVTNENTR